jgi:hypothetical protein
MVRLIGATARTRHPPTANTRPQDRKCVHAQTAPDPRERKCVHAQTFCHPSHLANSATHWCCCKNPSSTDGKHETPRPEVYPRPDCSRSPTAEVRPRPHLLPSLASCPWCDSLVPLQEPVICRRRTRDPETGSASIPRPLQILESGSASMPRPSVVACVSPIVRLNGAAARTRHPPTTNMRPQDRKCVHAQTAPDPRERKGVHAHTFCRPSHLAHGATHWCPCRNPSSANGEHKTLRPEVRPCPDHSRSPRAEVRPRPDLLAEVLPSLVVPPYLQKE